MPLWAASLKEHVADWRRTDQSGNERKRFAMNPAEEPGDAEIQKAAAWKIADELEGLIGLARQNGLATLAYILYMARDEAIGQFENGKPT